MLQPEEIQKVTFEQSVFSGYKKEEVDAFLDKIHGEYSRLYKENAELVEKLKVCIAKIEEYRDDEKFLKSAIVNAQKLNETALQEIELKRKEVEEAARKQADDILNDAKIKAEQLTAENERKNAEYKERSTREHAQMQLDQANAFAAKKREYEAMIKIKEDEFTSLQERVDMFKASVLAIFEQQIDLISKLPEVEKETAVEPECDPSEQVLAIEESEPVVAEAVASEEPTIETAVAVEPIAKIEEAIAEETETVEVVAEEIPVAQTDVEEVPSEEEIVTDVITTEETPVESAAEDEYQAEQIDIEDLIAVKPSPVEPEAPTLPVIDEEEAPIEEHEEEFHLFGTSPLVFPTDIPDDEEDETPVMKEKGSRFKKKLKFGVDFDVKKDK